MAPLIIKPGPSHEKDPVQISLPWSKSLINRLLMIYRVGGFPLEQLLPYCDCRDSRELFEALKSNDVRISGGEGAAPYRFTLALMAALNRPITLEATGSMQKRSIAPLVDALREAGAEIKYLKQYGYPPVQILRGIKAFHRLKVRSEQSSQFASALMLVAPLFPGEKRIFTGTGVSSAYLQMSAALMKHCGVNTHFQQDTQEIIVASGSYAKPVQLPVEADWSAAAFFYVLASIQPELTLRMDGLSSQSLQGDCVLPELFSYLGVHTRRYSDGIEIHGGIPGNSMPGSLNFSSVPDLLPAFLVAAAVGKQHFRVEGVSHLAFKESDRLEAMARNLALFHVSFQAGGNDWIFDARSFRLNEKAYIQTFGDHRIAMAFAMLGALQEIQLDDGDCAAKSFPGFWEQLSLCKLNLDKPHGI